MTLKNELRAYTTKELAELYKVNERTFKRWIEPFSSTIGERNGHFFNINQVRTIFEKLGSPFNRFG
jgi:hypothetical protein